MKKYLLIALSIGIVTSVSYQIVYSDIFEDFKAGVKKVGSSIKEGFEATGDWFQDRANDLKQAFDQVGECAEVIPLGTEWAGKKAAYTVAKGVLDAAMELQRLDPARARLQLEKVGLLTARGTLIATRETAKGGLEAVRGLATATSELGQLVGKAMGGAFNIQRMEFDMNLADIKKGKLPKVGITATIAGKKIDFDLQINFKDIAGSAKSIIETAAKNIKF